MIPDGDFVELGEKQAEDDAKGQRKHHYLSNAFEKKLKGLESIVKGHIVCCARLPPLEEDACQRRL